MARGFLSGLIWGGAASVVTASAVSLVIGMPPGPNVTTAPTTSMSATPAAQPSSVVAPPTESTEPKTAEPARPTAEAAPSSAVDQTATQSAPLPEVAATAPSPSAPDVTGSAVTSAPSDEAKPILQEAVTAPQPPSSEAELSITTDPAQPPVPQSGTETAFPKAETETAALAPTGEAAASDDALPPSSAAQDPSAGVNAAMPAPSTDVTSPSIGSPAKEMPRVAALLPERPTSETAQSADAARPQIGTPAIPLTERSAGNASTFPTVAAQAPEVSEVDPLPAIKAFSAPFDNPEAKPLMAIILLDAGTSPVGLEALRAFPYPLTFAIDPTRPDAAEAMSKYRSAGFEVMVLADFPQGAVASDVEQNMSVFLSRLPESVAVMDGTTTGLQSDKAVATQATAMLKASGHGMVFLPKGLDTARKLAQKEGVPAATVFRDFDSEDQDAPTIRRFLDQAAFKASQETNGVIMLGRLRPETISALLLWGLQDRASRVALAPVSALLLQTE